MVNKTLYKEIKLNRNNDIANLRKEVRTIMAKMFFSQIGQTKMVTAASELARNTITFGNGGVVNIYRVTEDLIEGVTIVFKDFGPGITDIELALQDGYSTLNGMGVGLGGARRLVDDFQIESAINTGTIIKITKWLKNTIK
jgi:serine/threonine-protein kinase RsbT